MVKVSLSPESSPSRSPSRTRSPTRSPSRERSLSPSVASVPAAAAGAEGPLDRRQKRHKARAKRRAAQKARSGSPTARVSWNDLVVVESDSNARQATAQKTFEEGGPQASHPTRVREAIPGGKVRGKEGERASIPGFEPEAPAEPAKLGESQGRGKRQGERQAERKGQGRQEREAAEVISIHSTEVGKAPSAGRGGADGAAVQPPKFSQKSGGVFLGRILPLSRIVVMLVVLWARPQQREQAQL